MIRCDVVAPLLGHFESITSTPEGIAFSGWIIRPEKMYSSIRIHVDGNQVGLANHHARPDVARAYNSVPHAHQSGYDFRLDKQLLDDGNRHRIDLIVCDAGNPVGRISSWFRAENIDGSSPVPPGRLLTRVTGSPNELFYRIEGLRAFTDFYDHISRHITIPPGGRLLDWGCGCGRVTRHFVRELDGIEIIGCDVDAEATTWCSENITGATFSAIEPMPPTQYGDQFFDVVMGISVMTHLTPEAQHAWLDEMKRIIKPNGLFLATVHGPFITPFRVKQNADELLKDGIYSTLIDLQLEGVAPDDDTFDRATFQTRDYTMREFAKFFEILEYSPQGMQGAQDVVLMRRTA